MVETVPAAWTRRAAWADIAEAGAFGRTGLPGIMAEALDHGALASLIAPPEGCEALSRVVEERIGVSLPSQPCRVASVTHEAIWAGPDQWLLRARHRDGLEALLAELSSHAAVSDQSDARAVLCLSGPRVRDLLAKGVMLDLHPRAFPVAQVALTSIAHMGVHLWRTEDGPDGAVFEIAVARSMAGSFWAWFQASAAEFGYKVTTGQG